MLTSSSLLAQLDEALPAGGVRFTLSGGQQVRDYWSVETAVNPVCRPALQEHAPGGIDCCSGHEKFRPGVGPI